MSYDAKILLDSISPNGTRLTTLEITFPRIVLAEFNTHKVFSRNSASSRAIPVEKMLKKVQEDPFIPTYWGKNQKGMQAREELSEIDQQWAKAEWLKARDYAVERVRDLQDLDVHKQIANRLLEPFMWHTVIVTATEWTNFFNLRDHPDAQPEIREIAARMKWLYISSRPIQGYRDEWDDYYHLPLVSGVDINELRGKYSIREISNISAARCARVSYLTHDGKKDPDADLKLATRLRDSGHMSPFEHVGITNEEIWADKWSGNFKGWIQYRKLLPNEFVFSKMEEK